MKSYILPKKVFGSDREGILKGLLKRKDLQIGLAEKETYFFTKGDYLILDFGVEISGGVRILTYLADKIPVRIRFGESLTECCAELGGEKNATNDHSLRDFTVQLQHYSDMTFGQTGFRFVRLDFGGDLRLKTVVAESYILKKPAKYKYVGSDKRIAKIYECAKRTVDLCASKGYVWDGVKRDRLVWIGDMHPEMLALTTLYGRVKEVETSLDFVKNQTPFPGWMNGFPMYSMWWIIIVADYYQKTQAYDFAQKQLAYLHSLLSQMLDCVKENGELAYPSYFVDWPTCGQPDELLGVRAINILAARKAIWLLQEFQQPTAIAEDLLQRLLQVEIHPLKSKQVIGLKYFALGQLTKKDKALLLEGGAKGVSTFMSYYILKAIASFDEAAAIRIMKEYYGAMLDKGATTFWEDFNMDWAPGSCRIDKFPKPGEKDIHGDFGDYCYQGFRHSLCHGWSAGVIQFMQEHCNE